MQWIVEMWITGFLASGQPGMQANAFSQQRFPTLRACVDFIESKEYHLDEMELVEIMRSHMKNDDAKITVESGCRSVPVDEGEPA